MAESGFTGRGRCLGPQSAACADNRFIVGQQHRRDSNQGLPALWLAVPTPHSFGLACLVIRPPLQGLVVCPRTHASIAFHPLPRHRGPMHLCSLAPPPTHPQHRAHGCCALLSGPLPARVPHARVLPCPPPCGVLLVLADLIGNAAIGDAVRKRMARARPPQDSSKLVHECQDLKGLKAAPH